MRVTLAAGAARECTRVPPWLVVRRSALARHSPQGDGGSTPSASRRDRANVPVGHVVTLPAWAAPVVTLRFLFARSTATGRLRPFAISRSIRPPAGSPPEPLSCFLRSKKPANEPGTRSCFPPRWRVRPRALCIARAPATGVCPCQPLCARALLRLRRGSGGQSGASAPGRPDAKPSGLRGRSCRFLHSRPNTFHSKSAPASSEDRGRAPYELQDWSLAILPCVSNCACAR